MKRKIILLLFTALFAVGCREKTPTPFRLSNEFYTTANSGLNYDASYDEEVLNKVKAKASFAAYVYSVGCNACTSFSPLIDEYAKTNDIMIYAVSIFDVQAAGGALKTASKYTPYVALFKTGRIVATLDPLKDAHKDYFRTIEGFSTWFETYVDVSEN